MQEDSKKKRKRKVSSSSSDSSSSSSSSSDSSSSSSSDSSGSSGSGSRYASKLPVLHCIEQRVAAAPTRQIAPVRRKRRRRRRRRKIECKPRRCHPESSGHGYTRVSLNLVVDTSVSIQNFVPQHNGVLLCTAQNNTAYRNRFKNAVDQNDFLRFESTSISIFNMKSCLSYHLSQ